MQNPPKRRLVTVRRVSKITPIGRSRYNVVTIDGWNVVTRRLERHKEGHFVVYFEIDSFLPDTGYFWEYCTNSATKLDGEVGYLVRTTMMAKHLSQGLIFGVERFPEIQSAFNDLKASLPEDAAERELMPMSFEEALGVKKWDSASSHVDSLKGFGRPPVFFPQPRCNRAQNIPKLFENNGQLKYQTTEKLDGVPMTVYAVEKSSQWYPGLPKLPSDQQHRASVRAGVCSRQQDLAEDQDSWFWQTAKRQGILDKIDQAGKNIAVQGELCGSSILGNSMGCAPGEHRFYVFNIYDIDKQRPLRPAQVLQICDKLGWDHTPVVAHRIALNRFANDIDDLLEKAEGVGLLGWKREGLVFKELSANFAFKVIANSWLLETRKD